MLWTGAYLKEVIQVFKHANANLVQVFEETIEDGNQIRCCQLVPKNNRQLVYGESQRTPHLPLRVRNKWIIAAVDKKASGKNPFFWNGKTMTDFYWTRA